MKACGSSLIFFSGACAHVVLEQPMSQLDTAGQVCPGYVVTVPDTLDLARRAEIALEGLTHTLDPEMDYEMWFWARFFTNPPYMWHENTGLPTNNPKFAESFVMMRDMAGSEQHLDVQRAMMQAMLKHIGEDGLYYASAAGRPWHENVGHKVQLITGDDFANVYGNSRFLLALIAWMQWEPQGPWRQYAQGVASGLARVAVTKDDYAYYPDNGVGEAFSFPRSGWRHTDEPQVEIMGAESSMFMYHCGPIRALSRWYRLTGDEQALAAAERLVRFVTKERFWGIENFADDVDTIGRGYFVGHPHGHVAMLFAIEEYAQITGDMALHNFVRDSYDFMRHHGIPRLGAWRGAWQRDIEVCTIADMIAVAIKLTDAGMGDYYDDVDGAVRNHLAESQLLAPDLLRKVAEQSPRHEITGAHESEDRVIERNVGTMIPVDFCGHPEPYAMHCCTGNGTQALYYAWSKIIEPRSDGAVQINLLLNRASPWMDIDSYLPYEGKVVLRNKTARLVSVRIPYWVDADRMDVRVDGRQVKGRWVGRYLEMDGLSGGEQIVLQFPVPEQTVVYRYAKQEYRCRFKGSTAIEVTGPKGPLAYPIYLREAYEKDKAPMVEVRRCVKEQTVAW
jgi:hypothetical protein